MYVVTVHFRIVPERIDAFAEAIAEQARVSVETEPGCHLFDVCQDPDDRSAFFLYEKYADAGAFDDHLGSDHFRRFDTRVARWTQSKSVHTWRLTGTFP